MEHLFSTQGLSAKGKNEHSISDSATGSLLPQLLQTGALTGVPSWGTCFQGMQLMFLSRGQCYLWDDTCPSPSSATGKLQLYSPAHIGLPRSGLVRFGPRTWTPTLGPVHKHSWT